jgi:hypothetical protein
VYSETNENNDGIKVWKCPNSEVTTQLLSGSTVSVLWDNSIYLPMRLSGKDFILTYNGTDYRFERITETTVEPPSN